MSKVSWTLVREVYWSCLGSLMGLRVSWSLSQCLGPLGSAPLISRCRRLAAACSHGHGRGTRMQVEMHECFFKSLRVSHMLTYHRAKPVAWLSSESRVR